VDAFGKRRKTNAVFYFICVKNYKNFIFLEEKNYSATHWNAERDKIRFSLKTL
jgi:hypothetical protein